MTVTVNLMRLPHAEGLPLPRYETSQAAGMDLYAAVAEDGEITLESGKWGLVPTGLKLHLPEGYEAQVRPRSGLALKHGVTVLNAPGTIDADYRGELGVVLVNHGPAPFVVTRGMRVAQLVVAPVVQVVLAERSSLEETPRGRGGFGSTGV
ncbi:MAG: dUTP diphosphatase [Alsobacter sp.]